MEELMYICQQILDKVETLIEKVGKPSKSGTVRRSRKRLSDDEIKALVITLAQKVKEHEENKLERLSFTMGGYHVFSWSSQLSRQVASKAVEMGLLKKIRCGRNGFHLATADKQVAKK